MDLTAALGAVGRVLAGGLAAQRGGARAAIDGLPAPLHAARAGIEAHHDPKQVGKEAALLPMLEARMEHAAGNAEPVAVDRLPLTARSQHIPDAVEDGTRIRGWAARATLGGRRRQGTLEAPPDRARDAKVVHGSGFCGSMGRHDGSFLRLSGHTSIVSRFRRFVYLLPIYG
jgi:hypothetical protein